MTTPSDAQVEAALKAYGERASYVGDTAAMRAALTAAAQAGEENVTLGSYEGERVGPPLSAAPVTASLSASESVRGQGQPSPVVPPGMDDDYDSAKVLETGRRLLPHTIAGIRRAEEKIAERRQATSAPASLGRADDGEERRGFQAWVRDQHHGELCTHGIKEQRAPTWIIKFEDASRGEAHFNNETEAVDFYLQASNSYNCTLLTTVRIAATAPPAQSGEGEIQALREWGADNGRLRNEVATLTQNLAEAEKVIEPFASGATDCDERIEALRALSVWLERRRTGGERK